MQSFDMNVVLNIRCLGEIKGNFQKNIKKDLKL